MEGLRMMCNGPKSPSTPLLFHFPPKFSQAIRQINALMVSESLPLAPDSLHDTKTLVSSYLPEIQNDDQVIAEFAGLVVMRVAKIIQE